LLDYDAFWQGDNNIAQVGRQRDQWDLRSERFSLGGRIGSRRSPINYLAAVEYKGFDRPPDSKGWGSTDLSIGVPVGRPQYGTITFGKTKETFSHEMAGDAANLPQMERLLSPFFTSRNVVIRYFNTLANKRMTVSGGWFNDWWTKGNLYNASSNHYTGRVTFLPVLSKDGSSYLHLGFAARHIGAANGQLQYVSRPESNVTSVYGDTGKLNANFHGFYITGSWILTGEHRPYDSTVGYARRVIPLHKYGAWSWSVGSVESISQIRPSRAERSTPTVATSRGGETAVTA
jgi:phosphate-selective porin OprO/OprP